MPETRDYEIIFETDDPALLEDLIAATSPTDTGELEIAPGIVAEPEVDASSGLFESALLTTIAVKVVEGVATKLLVDLVVMLVKKYGAKLKINGKEVLGDDKAVAAELSI